MRPLSAVILVAVFLLPIATRAQHPIEQFHADWQPNPAIPPNGAEDYLWGTGDPGWISFLQRGAGVTQGDTMTNAFIGSNWTDPSLSAAHSNNRYLYFDAGTGPGVWVVALRSLAVNLIRSAGGPTWLQWEYSLDSFKTAGHAMGDSIHFTIADSSVLQQYNIRSNLDLQEISYAQFRLYAWGGTDSGGIFGIGPNPGQYSVDLEGDYASTRPAVGWGGCVFCAFGPTLSFTTDPTTPSAAGRTVASGEGIIDSITVIAPTDYELSSDSSNYYQEISFPGSPQGFQYAGGTIYVRLKAGLASGTYNETLYVTSHNVMPNTWPLTGTVNPAPVHALSVSSNTLEFGNTATGTTADKKLTLTTTTLSSDIIATSPPQYQISTDSLNFASTITLSHVTAENKTIPLFIRFSPNTSNTTFNDSLTISEASDTTLLIRMKGNSLLPATTLTMSTWNSNDLATPQLYQGPPDKTQQINTIRSILTTTHNDVYALQEVVNEPSLADIVSTMPGYAYVISNFGSRSNPSDLNPLALPLVPKLAFVYNTAKLRNVQTRALLTTGLNSAGDATSPGYTSWALGRYPFMMTADVNLSDSIGNTITKTIHFINIEAKENLGDVDTAYTLRMKAATSLDSVIKSDFNGQNVVILGSFNDDLAHSTTIGKDTTSFIAFINDSSLFAFPTKALSSQQQHSNAFTPGVTDNIVVNNTMAAWYLPSSSLVLSQVAAQSPDYSTVTAGHYPVASGFSFTPPVTLPITLLDFTAMRQGSKARLSWKTTNGSNAVSFTIERSGNNSSFTAIGIVPAQNSIKQNLSYHFTDASPLSGNDYYRLKMGDQDGNISYSKTVLLTFPSITLQISPNPAHGTANLVIGDNTEAFFIQVIDGDGRPIRQYRTTPGDTVFPISLNGLSKGVYTVKVSGATSAVTQSLLVN